MAAAWDRMPKYLILLDFLLRAEFGFEELLDKFTRKHTLLEVPPATLVVSGSQTPFALFQVLWWLSRNSTLWHSKGPVPYFGFGVTLWLQMMPSWRSHLQKVFWPRVGGCWRWCSAYFPIIPRSLLPLYPRYPVSRGMALFSNSSCVWVGFFLTYLILAL